MDGIEVTSYFNFMRFTWALNVRTDIPHIRQVEKLDAQMDWLCRAVQRLMTAVLYSAGFHQHDRGEWRKRRRGHPR
jgi:hypothetical protein